MVALIVIACIVVGAFGAAFIYDRRVRRRGESTRSSGDMSRAAFEYDMRLDSGRLSVSPDTAAPDSATQEPVFRRPGPGD